MPYKVTYYTESETDMTIVISDSKTNREYYNVPEKVAKAVITLLNECGNSETKIVTAESETMHYPQVAGFTPVVIAEDKGE